MGSELKHIRRACIEHGKKHRSCEGCTMFQKIDLPKEKLTAEQETVIFCVLGIPAKWNIEKIRTWLNGSSMPAIPKM